MKKQNLSNETTTHNNLTLREVRWEDLAAITQLIYGVCEAEGDTAVAVSEEDLKNEWAFEGFDPQQDAFVLQTTEGKLAGYAALYDIDQHGELSGDIYLHPDFDAHLIGQRLLQALHKRGTLHISLAPADQRVFMRTPVDNQNQLIKKLFLSEGYQAVRYHWRMQIDLANPPELSALPDSLTLHPFIWEEHARAVWQMRNEAFKENWGSHQLSFEEFSYFTKENPAYDPSLWMVLWDSQQIAGFCINHMRMGIGWIHILGVAPTWRGKGLGLNLLQHSFAAFHKRGISSIGLGVDAANESGATRLYQRAGMLTISEFVTFEKELRAGK